MNKNHSLFSSRFFKAVFLSASALCIQSVGYAQWAPTGASGNTNINNTNSTGNVGIGAVPYFQGRLSIAAPSSIPAIMLYGGSTFLRTSLTTTKWNMTTSSGDASLGIITNNANASNGFGLLNGAELASPIVWMYRSDLGNNAFTVASKGYGDVSSIESTLTPLFQVRQNGTVLIGQTASRATAGKYKLDVLGGVRANMVVVNTDGADFVFEQGYKLKPLSEVESFIQANHHLPEIAPAAEMQKEGVDVGELQTQLLQKIEELTLYMIVGQTHDFANLV
ncbi:MAG: hypothetical protein V4714_22640 [Bacteroidota bacterium]